VKKTFLFRSDKIIEVGGGSFRLPWGLALRLQAKDMCWEEKNKNGACIIGTPGLLLGRILFP